MPIQKLSNLIINQIAAGEVIEKPYSVVKELVENSIDAQAKNISIEIEAGGKNLIKIIDDGVGINHQELPLAFERHATSKLSGKNLLNISTMGFRGEALASIASIAKVKITSVTKDSKAHSLEIKAGIAEKIISAKLSKGTIIEIRDLFFATPARLKFLKNDRYEENQITEIIKKIALANPSISFSLITDGKAKLNYKAVNNEYLDLRYANILDSNFIDNSHKINYEEQDIKIEGRISYPNLNRGMSDKQFFFVNKRSVKDKIFHSAIRSAYYDFLAKDRHPICLIHLTLPYFEVDINAHPAKTEIRFRDSEKIKKIIKNAFKQALENNNFNFNQSSFENVKLAVKKNKHFFHQKGQEKTNYFNINQDNLVSSSQLTNKTVIPKSNLALELDSKPQFRDFQIPDYQEEINQNQEFPLGAAICQIHETYVISQTQDALFIVDQHAVAERIKYEKTKNNLAQEPIKTQTHLISEIIELEEKQIIELMNFQTELSNYGLRFEKFGIKALTLKETPDFITSDNFHNFFSELADSIIENKSLVFIQKKFKDHYGNIACSNSLRSGRKLNMKEMNQLLRDMENISHTSSCNHGRPTFIKLKKTDIENLFERS